MINGTTRALYGFMSRDSQHERRFGKTAQRGNQLSNLGGRSWNLWYSESFLFLW